MTQNLRRIGIVLLWLAAFAAAGLPAVFMNSIYGYLPVLFLLAALLISIGCLFYLKRHLSVEADFADVQCERGGSVTLGLKLVNHSLVFCPKASAQLMISDLFGQTDDSKKISFTMAGKETVQFGFDMDMLHIGVYSVGLEQVEICDFFGVLRSSVPVTGRFHAYVMPRRRAMNEVYSAEQLYAEANMDTKITVVGGTDYTGVREYTLGDPMKQIHWKLSAHSREYMTKMQESNRQQEFSVILDFAAKANGNKEQLMDINDCLIETALSLLEDISREDAAYALLYCDKTQTIVRTAPTGREDDLELLRSFSVITPDPGREYPDACQILRSEGRMQNRATNTIVVTSRVTDELLQELQRIKRQRRSPELYMIVPAEWNSRELEKETAPLHQLEDAEIPYYIVSTAETQPVSA